MKFIKLDIPGSGFLFGILTNAVFLKYSQVSRLPSLHRPWKAICLALRAACTLRSHRGRLSTRLGAIPFHACFPLTARPQILQRLRLCLLLQLYLLQHLGEETDIACTAYIFKNKLRNKSCLFSNPLFSYILLIINIINIHSFKKP